MNLLYDLEKVYDSNKDKIGETIVVNEKINRTAILLQFSIPSCPDIYCLHRHARKFSGCVSRSG